MQEQELAAKTLLEHYLGMYANELRTMRSYHQHLQLGGQSDSTQKLKEFVERNSERKFNIDESGLFAIELDISKVGSRYAGEDPERYGAILRGIHDSHEWYPNHIKGLWFMLYHESLKYECLVFDRGKSSIIFEGFDRRTKEQLAKEVSERHGKTPDYVSFMLSSEVGEIEVDTILKI